MPLANFLPITLSWQRPSDDDRSTKIRTWVPLVAQPRTEAAEQCVEAPNRVHLTISVRRSSRQKAIMSKLRYNYAKVLDHIPFGRYLRVSIFLVLSNIVLTVFSSSLVAYVFAGLN